jgi:hypothetical protein
MKKLGRNRKRLNFMVDRCIDDGEEQAMSDRLYSGKVPKYYVTTWAVLPAEAHKIEPGVPFIRIG